MRYLKWLALATLLIPIAAKGMGFHVVSKQANIDLNTLKVSIVVGTIDSTIAMIYESEVYDTMGLPGDRLVLIDSNGGSTTEGNKIISLIEMEKSNGTRVVCFVPKMAASMAFNILTHCDVRIAGAKAHLLFHKIAYDYSENKVELSRLTAKVLREMARDLDHDDLAYSRPNMKALRMSARDYSLFADKDHQWKAKDLLRRGYLHGFGDFSK